MGGQFVFRTALAGNPAVGMFAAVNGGLIAMLEQQIGTLNVVHVTVPHVATFVDQGCLTLINSDRQAFKFVANTPNDQPQPFQVPLSFWSTAKINPAGVHISLESPAASLDGLLVHEPIDISGDLRDRRLIVKSSSATDVIVGFAMKAQFGRSYPDASVVVYDRIYRLGLRTVLIPLKPCEMKPGATHVLTVRGEGQIVLLFIDPFVLPAAALKDDTGQESLFNFARRPLEGGSVVDKLFDKVSGYAMVEVDELFVDVAKCIYQNVEYAEYFRAIATRSAKKDENKAMELWAEAIRELLTIEVQTVNNWSALWRDIGLLPDEVRRDLAALMWTHKNNEKSVESALCAFLA
jgi:hypothetical protein